MGRRSAPLQLSRQAAIEVLSFILTEELIQLSELPESTKADNVLPFCTMGNDAFSRLPGQAADILHKDGELVNETADN